METLTIAPEMQVEAEHASHDDLLRNRIVGRIDDLMAELPDTGRMTAAERRGLIARYTAVLEGNFIYWMTATWLAVRADDARPHLIENLHEEVRDSHPAMLRRFALAAKAFPTEADALAVDADLAAVRLFLGRLQGVPSLVTMAFFEAWIQKFMPYLADLAAAQGSSDFEYTDVHGICDIAHSEELFHAVSLEMAAHPPSARTGCFEGVDLLSKLIRTILHGAAPQPA